MQYRMLGRTGLRVSEIGFGGAPLGIPNYNEAWDPHDPTTTRTAIGAIHQALDLGYTYFDTAPSYGDGRSEEIMGEALAGRRAQVVLATKTEWQGQSRDEIRARRGFSATLVHRLPRRAAVPRQRLHAGRPARHHRGRAAGGVSGTQASGHHPVHRHHR